MKEEANEKMVLFTSECVSPGHPDKVADAISDMLVNEFLKQDPDSRVAVETLVTTGQVVVAGEVTTKGYINIPDNVRAVVKRIGYDKGEYGFSDACGVLVAVHEQSPDIALGTNDSVGGACDQGMMFGGAVNETPELMPLPIAISRAIINRLVEARKSKQISWLRPDSKSQVTVKYKNGKPVGIHTVVVSTQHDPMEHKEISDTVCKLIITPVLKDYGYSLDGVRVLVNPTGNFVLGGPAGDSGLTGRKIIVDTYGGYFSHGGGAFSGKDPTKVDRSSAYAVRHIAKNIVAAELADKCQVQISYAIGVAEPISLNIETYGTEKVCTDKLLEIVRGLFDLTPRAIIKRFNLKDAKYIDYEDLAGKGHFGRTDRALPWEELDYVDKLKKAFT